MGRNATVKKSKRINQMKKINQNKRCGCKGAPKPPVVQPPQPK